MPWFVLSFVAMMLFKSLDLFVQPDKTYLMRATTFLLRIAAAGMGVATDVRKLGESLQAIASRCRSWVFISMFKRAPELGTTAPILVHNHSSGDLTPSKADITVTQDIKKATVPLGVVLHDMSSWAATATPACAS